MVTREEVLVEIREMPEEYLDELYRIIKDFRIDTRDGSVRRKRDGYGCNSRTMILTVSL